MKVTDYAPRASAFDLRLKGRDLVGVEVGVDVGAHAHALLAYCDVKMLHLVDVWDRDFYRGYCMGRLHTHGYVHRASMFSGDSLQAMGHFDEQTLDFVYLDQRHDYDVVKTDLVGWWPKLKRGGVLGLRNYATVNAGLVQAANEFTTFLKKLDLYDAKNNGVDMNDLILFKL